MCTGNCELHVLLARTWSHGCLSLQGSLGNVVLLCAQEEKGGWVGDQLAVFASCTQQLGDSLKAT